jgi:hypothetical protein
MLALPCRHYRSTTLKIMLIILRSMGIERVLKREKLKEFLKDSPDLRKL